jgi:hypothetical protein
VSFLGVSGSGGVLVGRIAALRARLYGAVYGYSNGLTTVEAQFLPIDTRGVGADYTILASFSVTVRLAGSRGTRTIPLGTAVVEPGAYGRVTVGKGSPVFAIPLRPGEEVEAINGGIEVQYKGTPLLSSDHLSPVAEFTVNLMNQISRPPR